MNAGEVQIKFSGTIKLEAACPEELCTSRDRLYRADKDNSHKYEAQLQLSLFRKLPRSVGSECICLQDRLSVPPGRDGS
jgi:hypothetical protein